MNNSYPNNYPGAYTPPKQKKKPLEFNKGAAGCGITSMAFFSITLFFMIRGNFALIPILGLVCGILLTVIIYACNKKSVFAPIGFMLIFLIQTAIHTIFSVTIISAVEGNNILSSSLDALIDVADSNFGVLLITVGFFSMLAVNMLIPVFLIISVFSAAGGFRSKVPVRLASIFLMVGNFVFIGCLFTSFFIMMSESSYVLDGIFQLGSERGIITLFVLLVLPLAFILLYAAEKSFVNSNRIFSLFPGRNDFEEEIPVGFDSPYAGAIGVAAGAQPQFTAQPGQYNAQPPVYGGQPQVQPHQYPTYPQQNPVYTAPNGAYTPARQVPAGSRTPYAAQAPRNPNPNPTYQQQAYNRPVTVPQNTPYTVPRTQGANPYAAQPASAHSMPAGAAGTDTSSFRAVPQTQRREGSDASSEQ